MAMEARQARDGAIIAPRSAQSGADGSAGSACMMCFDNCYGPCSMLACCCSFAYGFSTSIQGNVCHLEGQKLLYPAGQFFAVMGTHADDGKVQTQSSDSAPPLNYV